MNKPKKKNDYSHVISSFKHLRSACILKKSIGYKQTMHSGKNMYKNIVLKR